MTHHDEEKSKLDPMHAFITALIVIETQTWKHTKQKRHQNPVSIQICGAKYEGKHFHFK